MGAEYGNWDLIFWLALLVLLMTVWLRHPEARQ